MGDWKFGDKIKIEDHIGDIIGINKKLVSTDVQLLLRERYERAYGINSHADANDHFGLVRMHWSEDPIGASRLRERMDAFKKHRIGDVFKISFKEFLEQPPYECDLMIEVIASSPPDEGSREMEDLIKMLREGKGK